MFGVDGTAPNRRPSASLCSGRAAACEERRIGQGRQGRVRQQNEARTRAGPVLHRGTVPQRGGIPVNMREALAGGARWASQGIRVPAVERQRGGGYGSLSVCPFVAVHLPRQILLEFENEHFIRLDPFQLLPQDPSLEIKIC